MRRSQTRHKRGGNPQGIVLNAFSNLDSIVFLPCFSGLSAVSLADLNASNQDKGDGVSRKGTLSRLKKAVSLGSLSGSGEKKYKKVGKV